MKVQWFRWSLCWPLLCLASWLSMPALAAERVALVIGNGVYSGANPLPNASNDARAVAALLEQLDFQVLEGIDLAHDAMVDLLAEFADSLDEAQVGLFFYSGHGLQTRQQNYLLPVDTDFEQLSLPRTLPLADVLRVLEGAPTRLMLLDAAWENPLAGATDAVQPGLAPVAPPANGLVALSAQPDRPIPYREEENSAFALALLEVLESPGRDLSTLLMEAAARVTRQTDRQQLPWVGVNLDSPLHLADAAPPAVALPEAEAPVEEATSPNPDLLSQAAKVEQVVFETARKIRMPALRELALEDYLGRYPAGRYAAEARRLLSELREGLSRQEPGLVHWHPAPDPDEPRLATREQAEIETLPPPPPSGPELAEQQLDLDRAQRREGQWALTALGFDTGGVDGIFGSRTRQSISAFQAARGLEATGFLQQSGWQRLLREGETPVAELKAEQAERARLAAVRRQQQEVEATRQVVESPPPAQPTRVVVANPEVQMRLQRLESELEDVRWRLQREKASASGARWTLQLDYQARIESLEREIQSLRAQAGLR